MKLFLVIMVLTLLGASAQAEKRQKLPYEPEDEPAVPLGYTHLLPSTSVIPGGTAVVGTTLGYGFFGVFDITTNLFLDLVQDFNIMGKVHLYRDDEFGVAVYVGYDSQSAKVYDAVVPGQIDTNTYTSLQPGGVVSYYLLPQLTGHTGMTFTVRNPTLPKSSLSQKDGFIQGNFANQEFTFGINRGVALSTGASYDFTYDIWGAGASIHLGGLQIGAHYYFKVDVDSFLPILGFSYAMN